MSADDAMVALSDLYRYEVRWSPSRSAYVATCAELPALVLVSPSRAQAVAEIAALAARAVAELRLLGRRPPEPVSSDLPHREPAELRQWGIPVRALAEPYRLSRRRVMP